MKNRIIAILVFSISISFYWGQDWKPEDQYEKLFFIEDFSKIQNYKTSSYTMNTKELYGIDKKIEINNVLIKNYKGEDWGILLITALPDLKGNNDWVKVRYDLIKDKIIKNPTIKDVSFKNSLDAHEENVMKTLNYGIVKKIGNDYFIPNHCLMEYFTVASYNYPLVSTNRTTINIKENFVTIKEMSELYKETFSSDREPFPLDMSNFAFELVGINPDLIRYYHSKNYKIKNEDAYQFWTLNAWIVRDGYNTQRGIDRFVYIPGKGIVGGSYDFYFEFNSGRGTIIPFKSFWNLILNEKIMIAEELK
ncbi:hypothetical protein M2T92_17495 [Elizabethkingia miricola]|uniref:hypothetical protein n=1 Tax=Elizabethkingia miricola TaxID=172045 RepID=UPI00201170B7|nr:hypothetical protein [Elizabethkingia miricola]MCL1680836.1 hypothetical protein [Elizabethkingia miricola]